MHSRVRRRSAAGSELAEVLQRLPVILGARVGQLEIGRVLRSSSAVHARSHVAIPCVRTLAHELLEVRGLRNSRYLDAQAHVIQLLRDDWRSCLLRAPAGGHWHQATTRLKLLLTIAWHATNVGMRWWKGQIRWHICHVCRLVLSGLVASALLMRALLQLRGSDLLIYLLLKNALPFCQLIVTLA